MVIDSFLMEIVWKVSDAFSRNAYLATTLEILEACLGWKEISVSLSFSECPEGANLDRIGIRLTPVAMSTTLIQPAQNKYS